MHFFALSFLAKALLEVVIGQEKEKGVLTMDTPRAKLLEYLPSSPPSSGHNKHPTNVSRALHFRELHNF